MISGSSSEKVIVFSDMFFVCHIPARPPLIVILERRNAPARGGSAFGGKDPSCFILSSQGAPALSSPNGVIGDPAQRASAPLLPSHRSSTFHSHVLALSRSAFPRERTRRRKKNASDDGGFRHHSELRPPVSTSGPSQAKTARSTMSGDGRPSTGRILRGVEGVRWF